MARKSSVKKADRSAGKKSKPRQTKPGVKISSKNSGVGADVEPRRQLKIQRALYQIADAASAVRDMQSFYRKLHNIVGKLMYAENFFIALYDSKTDLITWPYFVDTVDPVLPPTKLSDFQGATGWVLRHGKTIANADGSWNAAKARGEARNVGTESTGIAAPLKVRSETIGVVFVQSYIEGVGYQPEDVKVLEFVAKHIATALTRARALEAERQRTEELARSNKIQSALYKIADAASASHDMQEFYARVHRVVGGLMYAENFFIALHDEQSDLITWPYVVDTVYPDALPPTRLSEQRGATGWVLRHGRTITDVDGGWAAALARQEVREQGREWTGIAVPLKMKSRTGGVLMIQSYDDSGTGYQLDDVRVLEFVAQHIATSLARVSALEAERERTEELAIVNAVQAAIASRLDFQGIVDIVGDKLTELFPNGDVGIGFLDETGKLLKVPYLNELGRRVEEVEVPIGDQGLNSHIVKTRRPLVINRDYKTVGARLGALEITPAPAPQSWLGVPIINNHEVVGTFVLQNWEQEDAFSDSDVRLLQTLADSVSLALENARLFKAEQDRVAELQIINSIQQGLAAQMDIQGIYDLIGERLQGIFPGKDVEIRIYDPVDDMMHFPYSIQEGKRLQHESIPLGDRGFAAHVIHHREVLLINKGAAEAMKKYKSFIIPGAKAPRSLLFVPLIMGGEARGMLLLSDVQAENAFTDSDVRLVQTLAGSMSVALENVRLFDEVQRKNAEITESLERETASNNILQVIAESPIDIQPVLDVIARSAAQLSGSEDAVIAVVDGNTLRVSAHYGGIPMIPVGEGIPFNRDSVAGRSIMDGRPLQALHGQGNAKSEYPDGDRVAKKYGYRMTCSVPLLREGKAVGAISIRRLKPELLSEKQIALIQSFANQAAIAVENVRLFEAEQQRVAELQIINSIQLGLASRLEFQSIIDMVGDKVLEITSAQSVFIALYDRSTENISWPYWATVDGTRIDTPDEPFGQRKSITRRILTSTGPINLGTEQEILAHDAIPPDGYTVGKSFLGVPFAIGKSILGALSIQDVDREHAFGDSDVRLLQTLASSMSVALQNARLFDETQHLLKEMEERNAELAIINSVQQALAARLDMQGIYDVVGDKIRDIFDAQSVLIMMFDHATRTRHSKYNWEKGERYYIPETLPFNKFAEQLIATKETLVMNQYAEDFGKELGMVVTPGTDPMKSGVFVPLISSGLVTGVISIQNIDHENAFDPPDVRLLETLANSMSIALENARLFDETQRLLKETESRNAELAVINSIQKGLATELEIQGIIDLVGEKVQEIFGVSEVEIATYDPVTNMVSFPYWSTHEGRVRQDPLPLGRGIMSHIIETRQPLMMNQANREEIIGMAVMPGRLKMRKSLIGAPLISGSEVIGAISLHDPVQENAYSDGDMRLLTTIASSMSVALENARLFNETQRLLKETEQRAAELAIINSVQTGLASKLEMQAIYDLVGDKIREIFDAQGAGITIIDRVQNRILLKYLFEEGQVYRDKSVPMGQGLSSVVFETRQTLLIQSPQDIERYRDKFVYPGSQTVAKSWLTVPILIGREIIGGLNVQNFERQNAFSESDVRLLQTFASSLGVALENARLFDEERRRATELSAISTVSQALVAETDLDSMIQLVGGQMREIFDADIVYVALLDKETNIIRFPYTFGESFEDMILGEGLTSRIIGSGEPLLINRNLVERRKELGAKLVGRESLSYLGVPIKSGGEIIGVVSVQSTTTEGLFNEDSQRLLTTIAANIGIAMEHARLFAEIRENNREITESLQQQTATSEILRVTASSPTDIQPVLDVIAENARRLCEATLSAVYRTDGTMVYEVATSDESTEMLDETHEVSEQSYPLRLDRDSSLSSRAILDRATLHIPDLSAEPDLPEITRRYVQAKILKSALFVPMIREGEAIGSIGVGKRVASPFTEKQIAVLQTFASQAVIAIENVRLFNELQQRNREISENLEQQTATSRILGVMAGSPTDIQPVLDEITLNAVKLLGGAFGNLYRTDGKLVYEAAQYNFPPEAIEEAKRSYPAPLAMDRLSSRTILKQEITHLPDMTHQSDLPEVTLRYMKSLNMQCILMVPLMREGKAIGCIGVGKHEPSPFSEKQIALLQTFASQAVIAIENVRLFNELQQSNREITENLEQQTATSDVLRVIAQSPTNVQPVLDIIAENARRLLNGLVGGVYLVDGDMIDEAATSNYTLEGLDLHDRTYPRQIGYDSSTSSRTVLERAVQNLPDVLNDPGIPELTRRYARALGMNSLLSVPMMREGEAIGAINVGRLEGGLFSEKQIALLQTFASQAVIALENVRLFNELQQRNREITESLEQQTATSEILRVIAESPTDVQPVFDAILERATILCGGIGGLAYWVKDGQIHLVSYYSHTGDIPQAFRDLQSRYPMPFDDKDIESNTASVIREGSLLHVADMKTDPRVSESNRALALRYGFGAAMWIPLIKDYKAMGVFGITKSETELFTGKQIALVETFARQAVIAVENVRLFNELQERNREITENLEQQTATSEILQVIASSPTDIQPIFDAIVERAKLLTDGAFSSVFLEDAGQIRLLSQRNLPPGALEEYKANYPRPLDPQAGLADRSILNNEIIHIPDVEGMEVPPFTKKMGKIIGYRSIICVPLVRSGKSIGTALVARVEPGPFTEKQIKLLETFASQAVIAIENVRLFTETQRLLKETEQRAAELQIINSIQRGLASKLDMQAIYELVGEKIRGVFDAHSMVIASYDNTAGLVHFNYLFEEGERLHLEPMPFTGLSRILIKTRQYVLINENMEKRAREYEIAPAPGSRLGKSGVWMPLVVGKVVRGVINLHNFERENAFSSSDVRLLQTLANSMSVALENARLFDETQRLLKETEQRAAELQIINSVQEGLSSKLDLQAIYSLVGDKIRDIFDAQVVGIYEFNHAEEMIHYSYYREKDRRLEHESRPFTPTAKHIIDTGRVLLINRNFVQRMDELKLEITPLPDATNPLSVVYVPLTSGGRVTGAIGLKNVDREDAFSELDVRLLQTLANSMSVALENARLFDETQRLLDEVTERKEYFEVLFKNNPVAVVTIDNDANVTSWNPAAEKLFGYTQEEAMGRNVDELVANRSDLHSEAVSYSRMGLDAASTAFQVIGKRTRRDDTLVDVEVSGVPIIVQNKKMGMYALYHDITELERARQEAIAANEAKSSFLATMSHEIRTPMNAVIGMSGLLLDTHLDDEQKDYAETIRNSGDALLTIINDILDFSKIEAGRMDIETRPFDLRECVESALDLIAARAMEQGLETAYIIEDDIPPVITGDVTRLRQILLNLFSNAVKFTEQGEIVLTVSRSNYISRPLPDKPGEVGTTLLFTVRDTGIGLSKEGISRLFQSFSQADASTTRRYGGTGLGLAISKRLAEMMGGTMWAESDGLGKGSKFMFTIRASVADLPEGEQREFTGVQPELKGRRMLIVDDNATNRKILRAQAEKWGMIPRDTEFPREALQWVQAGETFDLAIIDMQMPEMDGVELAKQIRTGGANLPMVLFSSLGRREAGVEEGMFAAYLTKPIKQSHLFDTLASLFEPKTREAKTASERFKLDPQFASRHPLKILLAEDNAVNQKLALRFLEQMGYRADVASNGLEAVESVARQKYDIILMDVQMPEMDGLEATRQIVARWTESHPRIIGLTANALEGDREMCLAAGMADYISKPIRVQELVSALERAYAEHRL